MSDRSLAGALRPFRLFPPLSEADPYLERAVREAERDRARWPASRLGVHAGGWSAPKRPEAALPSAQAALCRIARRALELAAPGLVEDARLEAWAVGLDPGGSIARHDHHLADAAFVLFLAPTDSEAGPLLLGEPGAEVEIPPYAGSLVAFPGTTPHRVRSAGWGVRWSLAANLYEEYGGQAGALEPSSRIVASR